MAEGDDPQAGRGGRQRHRRRHFRDAQRRLTRRSRGPSDSRSKCPPARRAFSSARRDRAESSGFWNSWLRNRVKRPLTFAIHYPYRRQASAGAGSGAIAGVTAMFRIAKPVSCSRASRSWPACRLSPPTIVEPPVVEAPPVYERRPISAAGTFAAISTITGRISAAPTTSPTASLLRRPDTRHRQLRLRRASRAPSRSAAVSATRSTNYFRTDLTADYWFELGLQRQTTGFCAGVVCVIDRHFVLQRLAAARQRLCRYRHLVRLHALCRRRHRRRAREVG